MKRVQCQNENSGTGSVESETIRDMGKSLHEAEHTSTWKSREVANGKKTVPAVKKCQGIQLRGQSRSRIRTGFGKQISESAFIPTATESHRNLLGRKVTWSDLYRRPITWANLWSMDSQGPWPATVLTIRWHDVTQRMGRREWILATFRRWNPQNKMIYWMGEMRRKPNSQEAAV